MVISLDLTNWKNPANHTNSRDPTMPTSTIAKRCYICDNVGHLAKHSSKARKTESAGGAQPPRNNNLSVTRQVTATHSESNSVIADEDSSVKSETGAALLEFLLSDSGAGNSSMYVFSYGSSVSWFS